MVWHYCSVEVGYHHFGGLCCLHLEQGLPKYWFPITVLHSITTQKTSTWIFTAVKSSYLALFCFHSGCVFVDGKEKTTKLPKLDKGSKVSFTCEHIQENKIRVNIDSNNKTVTYDWNISSPDLKLYFAICFRECEWKVLVEWKYFNCI